jgi:molecular chaperone GrpE
LESRDEMTLDPTGEPGAGTDAGEAGPEPERTRGADDSLADELASVAAALEEVEAELSRTQDRHLRMAAEYDNYRKRTERERTESWGRAQADLVGRLLDVLDDLERVEHYDESASSASLFEGVRLVDKKLRQVLEAAGLEPVNAEGKVFDPNSMEGLATVETDDPEEDDIVSDVFQRGYLFRGQLLRPARVRVKQFEG